jgi:DNA-directed RNA polymerase specialized sigma24 family protein
VTGYRITAGASGPEPRLSARQVRRLSAEQRAEIARLAREGVAAHRIAEILGISLTHATKLAREAGTVTPR